MAKKIVNFKQGEEESCIASCRAAERSGGTGKKMSRHEAGNTSF